jgi:hypothetical protein
LGALWGYIDKTGNLAIRPRFDDAAPFSESLALITQKGLFGFISHNGAYSICPQYKYAESFSDGRALVCDLPSGCSFINHEGRPALTEQFSFASSFFKGLAHVKLSDRTTFAYIDPDGRHVFTYRP